MTALYVYCVVKSARTPSQAKAPAGLPGASPLELVPITPSLWLAAAEVPLDRYSGAALERSLSDLDWVSRIALAHEAVVEHFSKRRSVTVVPMKLFTMFSSRDRAAAEFRKRRVSIDAAIDRITGAEEWGVRISRAVGGGSRAPADESRPATGAAFLRRKKQARDDARHARAAAAEAAIRAFDALSRIARTARRRELAAAEGTVPPLLDAAFLVPFARRATFTRAARQQADRCASVGAELTVSGPWPAYNFVQEAGQPR